MRYTIALLAALTVSCTVGPNYHRPVLAVPANFERRSPLPPPKAESLADLRWFEVFRDEQLQNLIRTALKRLRSALGGGQCGGRPGEPGCDPIESVPQRGGRQMSEFTVNVRSITRLSRSKTAASHYSSETDVGTSLSALLMYRSFLSRSQDTTTTRANGEKWVSGSTSFKRGERRVDRAPHPDTKNLGV